MNRLQPAFGQCPAFRALLVALVPLVLVGGPTLVMAQVRAVSAYWLADLVERINESTGLAGVEARAHVGALSRDIARFLNRPGGIAEPWEAPAAPPGSPIGDFPLRWLPEPFCSEPFALPGW